MRYLVVSDIHSNWEALEAVLAASQGAYDEVLCCGDLVGYGADPNRVVNWVRQSVNVVVRGNHDRACAGIENLEWFNPVARTATLWTQNELTEENRTYLRLLPKGPLSVEGFQLMHGSPLDEDEYLMNPDEATEAFAYLETSIAFFGHTHVQGGFEWRQRNVRNLAKLARDYDGISTFDLNPNAAYLINPGSVGQPRDGDARASFVLYDSAASYLNFHRVAYNLETAQRKIVSAGLPDFLAQRLGVGR